MKSFNIAAYISGSGSNLKSVIENSLKGVISSKVRLVIADKQVSGLDYPASMGIETAVVTRNELSRAEFLKAQSDLLKKHKIDLIILAGFIKSIFKFRVCYFIKLIQRKGYFPGCFRQFFYTGLFQLFCFRNFTFTVEYGVKNFVLQLI